MHSSTYRSGLQHATSLGNIEYLERNNNIQQSPGRSRNYDSEDENMGRKKTRPTSTGLQPRTSVYSKGDIREQYCLSDKQLNSIETRPRRDRFFGCWSARATPHSFLGVCVGRRAPSDENLNNDYAPFYKYPRYSTDSVPYQLRDDTAVAVGAAAASSIVAAAAEDDDDEQDNYYFRRRPTSFLMSGSWGQASDGQPRYTWMAANADTVQSMDAVRSLESGADRGAYVVGSYPPRNYLGGGEYVSGTYRCPAHIGLPPPPPPPSVPPDGMPIPVSRTKHVSFARSHTLTSFDEAMVHRTTSRLNAARSQERLIGGKKPMVPPLIATAAVTIVPPPTATIIPTAILPAHFQHHQHHLHHPHAPHHHHHHQQTVAVVGGHHIMQLASTGVQAGPPEVPTLERQKRAGVKKTTATQTDQSRKLAMAKQLQQQQHQQQHADGKSPRSVHRVKMVSHGSQVNGTLSNRQLTKSLSEVACRMPLHGHEGHPFHQQQPIDSGGGPFEHDFLCRTQSEDPPRSPCEPGFLTRQPRSHDDDGDDDDDDGDDDDDDGVDDTPHQPPHHAHQHHHHMHQHRRSFSHQPPSAYADHPPPQSSVVHTTSASQTTPMPTHSRNHSQDSAASFRTTDVSMSQVSRESASSVHFSDQLTISRPASDGGLMMAADLSYDHRYETNSLPRQRCDRHRLEFHTYSLPRRPATSAAVSGHAHHAHHHHHHHYHQQQQDQIDAHTVPALSYASMDDSTMALGNVECSASLKDSVSSLHSEAEAMVPDSVPDATYDRPVGVHMTAAAMRSIGAAATLQRRRSSVTGGQTPIVAPQAPTLTPSDEYCSTCESESESENDADKADEQHPPEDDGEESEKEIFIDFKPRISPVISPRRLHKKRLQKQLSEGELQFNQRVENSLLAMGSTSEKDLNTSSDADEHPQEHPYVYRDQPIVDEGVCEKCSPPAGRRQMGQLSSEDAAAAHMRREAFRKRSTSMEEGGGLMGSVMMTTPTTDDELADAADEDRGALTVAPTKSNSPPSPYMDELSVSRAQSNFPSTDSLANDPTRDHSDGIWNESQATVLHADRSPSDTGHTLITPTSRRKNLLLQHQQRSSMDTEALEMEDFTEQHLKQLTTHVATIHTIAATTPTSAPKVVSKVATPPTIAVTPSLSIEANEERPRTDASSSSSDRSRPLTPTQADVHRSADEPSPSSVRKGSIEPSHAEPPYATAESLHHQLLLSHSDSGRTTNTDISECSTTNTEEYVSCSTEPSRRHTPSSASGTKRVTSSSSATTTTTTYVPVTAHGSSAAAHPPHHVVTGNGSSFESASSLYSLARVDAICEDATNPLLDDTLPLPPTPGQQLLRDGGPSPSHSMLSSSSSGSSSSHGSSSAGGGGGGARGKTTDAVRDRSHKKSSSPTTISSITSPASVDTVIAAAVVQQPRPVKSGANAASTMHAVAKQQTGRTNPEQGTPPATRGSLSDDNDEPYNSSSGNHETPPDEDTRLARQRRMREWNEEERRRRREKMRLDIERENMKSLTSPMRKPTAIVTATAEVAPTIVGGAFKQISPDDPAAMNVLDGTSPIKTRRFRPKARRAIRARSINDDTLPRRVRTPIVINVDDKSTTDASNTATSSKCSSTFSIPCQPPVLRARGIVCTKRGGTGTGSPAKRLQARSTESLRSVSPGSDSVFYSESADGLADHHVQCHNCGKQVDIVTAPSESQETISGAGATGDDAELMVVKPPAGFGDSPDGPRSPSSRAQPSTGARLYKKMDKRFRSEERHAGERRIYRHRQENARAKSEERGKDSTADVPLRPAGSTPCVAQQDAQHTTTYEEEHGIYLAYYRFRRWVCVVDTAVVAKRDFAKAELRDTTEHEREFRRIYAAITHRMVHRKSMLDMYHRQGLNIFSEMVSSEAAPPDSLRKKLEEIFKLMLKVWAKEGLALNALTGLKNATDKTVIVRRVSGEFGFRIHGSQPVVISAIEPDTPAESSGLEVGDIILTVNGVSVVDKTHSEVVQIAHTVSDVLEISVARTAAIIASETLESGTPSVCNGYLWRLNQAAQPHGGGGDGKKSQKWVRRWFQLRPDNCLYFYKTEGDTHPVGAIVLTKHTVEHCAGDIGRPFAFRIYVNEGLPLYLAADNEDAANRWVAVCGHAAKQCDPWLEMSTRNMKLPPNSIPRPDCFGYLMKLGNRWRTWSKRYCVLKDACLYFYHDGNSRNAFGMACLQGYRMQKPSNCHGKNHVFEISSPDPKFRSYQFCTESEMDKKRWLAALEYSIDRWMKAS